MREKREKTREKKWKLVDEKIVILWSFRKLDHENIIAIKKLCLESKFGPLLAMDYLDGGSLRDYLLNVKVSHRDH